LELNGSREKAGADSNLKINIRRRSSKVNEGHAELMARNDYITERVQG